MKNIKGIYVQKISLPGVAGVEAGKEVVKGGFAEFAFVRRVKTNLSYALNLSPDTK